MKTHSLNDIIWERSCHSWFVLTRMWVAMVIFPSSMPFDPSVLRSFSEMMRML